jgi:hypothetical protein
MIGDRKFLISIGYLSKACFHNSIHGDFEKHNILIGAFNLGVEVRSLKVVAQCLI